MNNSDILNEFDNIINEVNELIKNIYRDFDDLDDKLSHAETENDFNEINEANELLGLKDVRLSDCISELKSAKTSFLMYIKGV